MHHELFKCEKFRDRNPHEKQTKLSQDDNNDCFDKKKKKEREITNIWLFLLSVITYYFKAIRVTHIFTPKD